MLYGSITAFGSLVQHGAGPETRICIIGVELGSVLVLLRDTLAAQWGCCEDFHVSDTIGAFALSTCSTELLETSYMGRSVASCMDKCYGV